MSAFVIFDSNSQEYFSTAFKEEEKSQLSEDASEIPLQPSLMELMVFFVYILFKQEAAVEAEPLGTGCFLWIWTLLRAWIRPIQDHLLDGI